METAILKSLRESSRNNNKGAEDEKSDLEKLQEQFSGRFDGYEINLLSVDGDVFEFEVNISDFPDIKDVLTVNKQDLGIDKISEIFESKGKYKEPSMKEKMEAEKQARQLIEEIKQQHPEIGHDLRYNGIQSGFGASSDFYLFTVGNYGTFSVEELDLDSLKNKTEKQIEKMRS